MAATRSKVLQSSKKLGLVQLTVFSFLVGSSELAWGYAVAELDPTGKYGSGKSENTSFSGWKEEWSQAFFKCAEIPSIKPYFNKISSGDVKDIGPGKNWCTNSDVYKPANTRLFQLVTFKFLAQPESGYSETKTNSKSPNPPATGLFQIGPSDVEAHKCVTPENKPMYTGRPYIRGRLNDPRVTMLKDGKNNICCALKIAADEALGQNKKHGDVFASGKHGIMGRFWEPMRVQNTKAAQGEKMKDLINQACRDSLGKPGQYFTVAEVEKSRMVSGSSVVVDAGGTNESAK